jgi:hypothetical protein
VFSTIEQIRGIVSHDIDSDFVKSVAIGTAWQYGSLFDNLAETEGLTDAYRLEEFAKRRSLCAVNALVAAARKHGVPFDFRRLPCNGQSKILVKAGRVLLIQEPILTLDDSPRASEYKMDLADIHGLIRQTEFDLGDQPFSIRDWSGCLLGVLLHGAAGPHFTRSDKRLGSLMLAVPDASYSQWVMRLDLLRLAMFGAEDVPAEVETTSPTTEEPATQRDDVVVTPRKKSESA